MHDDTLKLIKPVKDNAAGHVVIDSRGRNVWQWKDDQGRDMQVDSTSIVLKRLENDALELEPTRKVPIQKEAAHEAAPEYSRRGGARSHEPDARGSAHSTVPARTAARTADRRSSRADERASQRSSRSRLDEPPSRGSGGGFDPYNRS